MKSPSVWKRLHLGAFVFFAAVMAAAQEPAGDVSCEVALPVECSAAAAPPQGRLPGVQSLPARDHASCLEQAREAASKCAARAADASEIQGRFRRGPIERRLELLAPRPQRPKSLELPITYGKNFEAEYEQFGYSPGFTPGVVNIGTDGRLWVRHEVYLQVREKEGKWAFPDFKQAVDAAVRRLPDVESFSWVWSSDSSYSDQRIYFDSAGRMYTLVQGVGTRLSGGKGTSFRPYLMASQDGGTSWSAVALSVPDERRNWRARIEHNDVNNDRSGVPPVLVFDKTENAPQRSTRLYLQLARWEAGALRLRPPLLISERSLLIENHSGAANSVVSTPRSIYVVYPGAQPESNASGTPSYLVVVDKEKWTIESESLVGFGGDAPAVDNHNIPGICIGPRQAVHVVLPGHQEVLRMRSGSMAGGTVNWSGSEQIGESVKKTGGYTYASLNCDGQGNIYIASRWAGDRYRFQLVLLHRLPDGQWLKARGNSHLVLVDPARPFYGAWRHKVSLDPAGRLYLFYAYYANQLAQPELTALQRRFPFERWGTVRELVPRMCVRDGDPRCWLHPMPEITRAVLRSPDAGRTWELLE